MYTPSKKILEKYADVLINFALNSGKGVNKKEVVFLQVPEVAKPLLITLRAAVLKAGAYPITEYLPDDYFRGFLELANEDQIKFFPAKLLKGKVDQMDHVVSVIAETNKYELKGVDPKKIMVRGEAFKQYIDWRNEKENAGNMTWTLGMYATNAMAKDVGMTLKEYWSQIIKGCYLDSSDPVKKWKETFSKIEKLRRKINSMDIKSFRVISTDTDLTIGVDKNRKWLGGSGRNIPSFEIFISPDWRKTQGKISFSEPLYRYGNLIKNVKLEFKNGVVVNSSASIGENILKEMIKTKDANKIGEFSLTDNRFSKITKFMGETLFDENTGGKYGNTHIALGMAYKDSYNGDPSKVKKSEWEKMGFNDSSVHTDIVSTTNRKVTATLTNGKEKVIYENGRFIV
ncbi:MAG TPA: aminopeptidase [Patescibacteria group bacterium]|nr:aminopeptidase [Patescibacteria group bacterium]